MLLVSFISYKSTFNYNLLPTNALFELMVLLSIGLVAKRMPLSAWAIIALSSVYIGYTLVVALQNGTHPVDYLLAFKAFVYLIFLSFFTGNKVLFNRETLISAFDFILILFLMKYVIWIAIGDGFRPGVFAENNFEIMLVLFWALTVWALQGELSLKQWLLLTAVIFLSGSRSGVVSYFAVMSILLIRQFDWKTLLKLGILGIIGVGVVAVFISRLSDGNLNSIDRVVFFQGLLIAMREWTFFDYLVGAPPLTELPDVVCQRMNYYKELFSAKDPAICYSVILHSFIMRVVHDHGFIGLFFLFWATNLLMKRSFVPPRARVGVLAVLFLNGLSVSSLNSVYALVGLIILVAAPYADKLSFIEFLKKQKPDEVRAAT
ncbi:hypothetical protein PALB_11680 [Pseudoalteromonas luteoviolacea B = ATCC 29581]|nr:hypothetical protein PALB_11680 [Pseudoalteromonas luteoviolacea B = ATCC 29581]